MKKRFHILVLFAFSGLLYGCPYSSQFSLDKEPLMLVDDALIGNWMAFIKHDRMPGEETITISLSKKNDTEYNISFTGYLDDLRRYNMVVNDSINGTAFISTVDKMQFLNINVYSRIYLAQIVWNGDKLSLLPLTESFTNRIMANNQQLKTMVSYHYHSRVHPALDNDFCLRDMIKLTAK